MPAKTFVATFFAGMARSYGGSIYLVVFNV
jgi:hypothetical protein